MLLTPLQTFIMILSVAAGVILTRALPFVLFPDSRPLPRLIDYLGRTLPVAMLGLLVIFALRNTPVLTPPHALPELIATAVIVGLHLWRHNTLLSIFAGTAVYMVLVQAVF